MIKCRVQGTSTYAKASADKGVQSTELSMPKNLTFETAPFLICVVGCSV